MSGGGAPNVLDAVLVLLIAFALVRGWRQGAWANSPVLAQQIRGSTVLRALDTALPAHPDIVGPVAALLDEQGFPQMFAGLGRARHRGRHPRLPGRPVRDGGAAGDRAERRR